MDPILDDFLFLGGRFDASLARLKEHGITYILNVASGGYYGEEGKHAIEPLSDYGDDDLAEFLPKCFDFIRKAKEANEKIIVHCQGGMNRAPTVVIAYLIKYEGFTLKDAIDLVTKRRPVAHPHIGYLRQLHKLEQQWTGTNSISLEDLEKRFPPITELFKQALVRPEKA